MPRRFLLVLLILGSPALGQSKARSIPNNLPDSFDFQVRKHRSNDVENAFVVDRIDVKSDGKLVQSLKFTGDDKPVAFNRDKILHYEDIDCDGFKDLLVRIIGGVHGDEWFHLFRYSPPKKKFIEYPGFAKLSFKSVNCKTKIVKTYVTSGAAGCFYEAGEYRWVNGNMRTVRTETQESQAEDGSFIRVIKSQKNNKLIKARREIPEDDCHAP